MSFVHVPVCIQRVVSDDELYKGKAVLFIVMLLEFEVVSVIHKQSKLLEFYVGGVVSKIK